MKLKAHAYSTDTLRTALSLVSHVRKTVVFRFSESHLTVVLVNALALHLEPQVWCKMPASAIFDLLEIQSLRDNTILLELNVDLFLQTLRNFERASNTAGLSIRLQRTEASHQNCRTRLASLALFYADTTPNGPAVHHTFKIPVRVLKSSHETLYVQEPELASVDVIMRLPPQFAATYRRLEKFKRLSSNEHVLLRAKGHGDGYLGLEMEDEGNYRVTVSWNQKLDIQRPESGTDRDDVEVRVRLRDWRLTSRVVSVCHRVVLIVSHQEACMLHCVLDDSDVEVIFHISGSRTAELE